MRLIESMLAPSINRVEFLRELSIVGLDHERVILEALSQVLSSQGDQKADDGSLQVEQHVFPVALEILSFMQRENRLDPELVAVALLHDVLEDDRSIDLTLFKRRFGSRIHEYVEMLTKPDWHLMPGETQDEKKEVRDKLYFERFDNAPLNVIIVKLADRLNNVSRLGLSQEEGKKERYIKETVDHYLPLARRHSLYFYERIDMKLCELKN